MKIYSIHFNRPDFIEIQKKCLDQIKGYDLIIVNNQANPEIESKCNELGIPFYNHTHSSQLSPSQSHGSALNFLKNIIDTSGEWCIIDHDVFIYKKIDLSGFDFASVRQERNGKFYLWPGFIASRGISISHIDFFPAEGFDTGGKTRILIDEGNSIKWLEEEYIGEKETEFLQNSKIIIKISDLAIHYLNGSCWMETSEKTIKEKNNFLIDSIRNTGLISI